MNLTITNEAARLYKEEIPLEKGETLRLFVRVGGCGSGGFSVGVNKEEPTSSSFQIEMDGITFFVNEDDFWYLNGMTIDYDSDLNLMTFDNPNIDNLEHPQS